MALLYEYQGGRETGLEWEFHKARHNSHSHNMLPGYRKDENLAIQRMH